MSEAPNQPSIAARLDLLRQHSYRLPTQDKRLIEAGQVAMLEYHERELARKMRSKARKLVLCSNCEDEVVAVMENGWCGRCYNIWASAPFRDSDDKLPMRRLKPEDLKPASRFELEQYGLI